MPAPKTNPRIIDGEWLLCLECRRDWPVMWNDESQIPVLVEINGRCIECGSEKVVRK
jgi:hypothetical protein